MNKVNLQQKFSLLNDYWNPKIVGELNGQQVKLAKFKGEFVWHQHDEEDELFLVIEGTLKVEFRDQTIMLNKNEFLIVPKGVEHRPVAEEEVSVLLFETATTVNTGNTKSDLTQKYLDKI